MSAFILVYHYPIVVKTGKTYGEASGTIKLNLKAERYDINNVELTQTFSNFKANERHTLLITNEKYLGLVTGAQVYWTYGGIARFDFRKLFKPNPIDIEYVEVNYMSHMDAK